jgi:hypothetical protein
MRESLLSLLILTFCFLSGKGQTHLSLFDTLYQLEDIRITLQYPFDSLYRSNQDEIKAFITVESKTGVLLKDEAITLNLRGKFRRMKCDMPPLLLNFRKSTLRRLELNEIDEIKLVTHCLKSPEGQENLMEERLCYQLYEAISPYSYRSIWLNVTYIDELKKHNSITSGAFFLEPDKVIMSRYGLEEKKQFNLAEDSVHFESYSNMVAFNCLIGNRDWSIIMSRNAKLFYSAVSAKFIIIPYDFDYSNLVSPTYRRETRPETMAHTYDRLYQGEYFQDKSGNILKGFLSQKEKVMETLMTSPGLLKDEQRKKIAKYLESWFDYVSKKTVSELTYGTVIPYKGGL